MVGLEKIHNKILKNLSVDNREGLLEILNIIFREVYVPKDWKCAIVTPIIKPNKPLGAEKSYRPISLTYCLGKSFFQMMSPSLEKMICP